MSLKESVFFVHQLYYGLRDPSFERSVPPGNPQLSDDGFAPFLWIIEQGFDQYIFVLSLEIRVHVDSD